MVSYQDVNAAKRFKIFGDITNSNPTVESLILIKTPLLSRLQN
jgi:hypothetical protein